MVLQFRNEVNKSLISIFSCCFKSKQPIEEESYLHYEEVATEFPVEFMQYFNFKPIETECNS